MNENILKLLHNIEEEDIVLLENGSPIYHNEVMSIYLAEYNDIKVNFIVFNDEALLEKELKERFKHSSYYLPSLLGYCNYSSLGIGLIFERLTGQNLTSTLRDTDIINKKKIDILLSLVNMFDFNSSRNLLLTSLRLEDIIIENVEPLRIKINKYPLFFHPNSFDDLLKLNNFEILQLAPDIINKAKDKGIIEPTIEQESWLLGLLAYEILEGKNLFEMDLGVGDSDCLDINKMTVDKILHIDNKYIHKSINSLPYNQYFKNILKKLLKLDSKQRIVPKLVKQMLNKSNVLEDLYTDYKNNTYINLANSITMNESNIHMDTQSLFDISHMKLNILLNNESTIPLNKESTEMKTNSLKENSEANIYNKKSEKSVKENIEKNILNKSEKVEENVENNFYTNNFNKIERIEKIDLKEESILLDSYIDHREENELVLEPETPKIEFLEIESVDNVNLLLNDECKKVHGQSDKKHTDELKELFHKDQNKSYMERLEKLAKEYSYNHTENYLAEIKDLVLKKDINNQELEIYNNITATLWECLMCIAFELLENDDIKSHQIFTNILYSTIDKSKVNNNKNLGIAKFHYAMSMKNIHNNFSLSLNLFLEAIKLIEKEGEGDTELGVQMKYYLGNLYDDMGMSDESINVLSKVLEKQVALFTEQHIYTARTYNCLGIAEDNRGNLRQAKDHYQKAYGIFKFLSFGLETIDSVKVLNNLAGIYYKWEDYRSCIKYYQTVLDVYKNKYGDTNANIAITYNNLSNCYAMLDNDQKALFYLKKSVEIFNKALGSSHIQTAMAHKNLGDLYLSIKDEKSAIDMFNKCVNIFLEKFGEDNDLYISTVSKIKKITTIKQEEKYLTD
jgi:hypothetical protein